MTTGEMIVETKYTLHNLILEDWLTTDLFTAKWWGSVLFIVFLYIIFFVLLNKRRFSEIFIFGTLLTIGTVFADTIGANFVLWTYKSRILPILPSFFKYDFSVVPVFYMLAYQYTSTWKNYMTWNIIVAGLISFGYFNVIIALGMFETRWPLWANFLYLVVASSLARVCVLGILAMEKKYK